ncbi:PQQ-binding-like beta-propeller repeat protein [Gemmata sp. JC717]|uniref:outer membrane protein assembly factor BamB family protein n=1 Tax=Gemmata algarum TaxID=2975278 RepID=UPI0021BADCDA|nr:PQQ-binding-like beta-propeller repeat protein [Gemmata algarum]MDY3555870.1 PQQ-binding-like beta-propeller repeat protein [Gemmata algarum]
MDLTSDGFEAERPQPIRSGWRRALLIFTALGAGGFAAGRIAYRLDSVTLPMTLVMLSTLAPFFALLGFGLWWLVFGDYGRVTRVLLALAAAAVVVAVPFLAQGFWVPQPGGMKMFGLIWGAPLAAAVAGLVLAFVPALRGWPAILVAMVAVSPWLLTRTEGVTGAFDLDVSFRWSTPPTAAAEKQLAGRATVAPTAVVADVPVGPADWTGFRGADRAGVAPVAAFQGWDGTAPKERWRKNPIGPAWSSVCVAGDFLFTQEQRGESESVVSYRTADGTEVWAHGDAGKHTDWASGAGPRATPTLANGRLFAATASGAIVALQAGSGAPLWRVDLKEKYGATKPPFGWSSSPLAVGELVVLSPAAPEAPRLVALSAATGELKWQTEAKGTYGYSSPQLSTVANVPLVLMFNGEGLFAHDPATGAEVWRYDGKVQANEPATVQPLVLAGDRIVIGGGIKGTGTRCLAVAKSGEKWSVTEKWATTKFTPVFNDVVRFGDFLFGLDTGRLVCLDLANGSIRWREGNYGSGQLLLVGDKLLVASEQGRLACVAASGDEYEELWALPAVKGKTWNHPVVAGGRLYFRNPTEMATYDLPGYMGRK